ncbi:L,D-transpeptidase family protein [Anaeromicropila populeti]|uniref:L,D-transpeptidase catalytic domain n=1 Tax=Anaeromicropila populeti TaxID=37658 RepID=A0A1I6IQK3_9FIRM|nr:L,D-transpeptidase family protein [Anaeromicropila populeti]SFR68909.1 L,D-transpeptidase catalytic domain [Anaeromicropila populeti]
MKKRLFSIRAKQLFILLFFIGIGLSYGKMDRSVHAAEKYPYLIKVNRKMSTLTVYEKDEKGKYTVPVKAMLCSPGWDTPLGTYQTKAKYRWKLLMEDVWGQYSTRIVDGILFHSVWYYERDPATLSNKQFNKLGTVCSHGCVRLSVEDAKWIYDNCSLGTTVTIYDSSDPGPLGKPQGIKLSINYGMGYDPTDIWSAGNPYITKKASITGAKSQSVKLGAAVNVLSGVKAYSSLGTDISSEIEVSVTYNGNNADGVDSKVPGKYKVIYSVTDGVGKSAKKTVTFTVKGSTAKPKLTGVKDILVGPDAKVNRTLVLKNVKASWNSKTISKKSIKTKIAKSEDSSYYDVTYSVTAENGKTKTASCKVFVDNEAPVFTGVENREIAWDTEVTEEFALEGIGVTDDYSEMSVDDIVVGIDKVDSKTYEITYIAQDDFLNEVSQVVTFQVTNFLRIENAKDLTISKYDVVSETYVRNQGITAFDYYTDVTYRMKIQIEESKPGVYTITLSISNEKGHTRETTVVYTKSEDY